MRKSKADIARAAHRIARDGQCLLSELAGPGHTFDALKRWVIDGKPDPRQKGKRIYLDGIKDQRTGEWWSSRAALERFAAAVVGEEVTPAGT